MAFSHTGYTTNLPLADVTGGKAWVAWEVDGAPLPVDHGGPARMLVPHLYFWKSAKWVAGLRLLDHDEPGSGSATATTTAATLARAALPGRLMAGPWRTATVVGVTDETPRAKTFRLRLPEPSATTSPASTSSCA